MMVRITGGTLKGIRITPANVAGLRPTTDRVRESLFQIVREYLEDARVLDLFAGTGVLGIEAISRGAREVVFVEHHRVIAAKLKDTIRRCGINEAVRVLVMPVARAIRHLTVRGEIFDIIFADPPYASPPEDVVMPFVHSLLRPEGLLIVEHDEGTLQHYDRSRWQREDRRCFGRTVISMFTPTTLHSSP